MPAAGNQGTSQAADKALSKAKKLKKKTVAAGPPNFPKAIPVRPGAATPRPGHEPHKGRQSTQAERTHVHKARIKRNKELAPRAAYVSLGKSVEKQANKANANQAATKNLKGDLAKKYAKENPDLFKAKTKRELKAAGFSPDIGVKLSTNAYKDLLAIGQTPVSTYHLAEPTGKALVHGDFKKAGKEALKAGKASVEPIIETAKHPKREFVKHPVFTGLMFSGVEGAVGRAAGATARSGALGAAAKSAAKTERVTKVVPGTSLQETKKYSPDVIRKAVQVANEKRKAGNAAFKESRGGPEAVPRDRMSEREVARRVDERIAVNEDIRRQNRENVTKETTKVLKGHEHAATSLIAQGIVKPHKADIERYISNLEAQHKDLKPREKWANKELRKELQKIADNPKVDLAGAKTAGEKYAAIVNARTDALVGHGMLAEEQALRAKLIPYAVSHMGAKHEHDHYVGPKGEKISPKAYVHLPKDEKSVFTRVEAQLTDGKGGKLSTDKILEHYKTNHSGKLPAFVTHKQRSRGSWNVRSETAPSIGTGRRTGKSVEAGLMDASPDMMVENAARIQGLKDAAEGYKGIVNEFAVKHEGKVYQADSRKAALETARNMRYDAEGNFLPGTHEMVPVRLTPFNGTKAQLESMIHDTHGDELYGSNSPIRDAIHSAVKGGEGDGPWTLIPKAAQKRINEHLNNMGGTVAEQAIGAGSGLFRKTVLSTSPTWLFGNVAEATLRSAIAGAGPLSHHRGVRVLREIEKNDPVLAQEIAHRIAGGGHFSTATRQQVFRSAEQFQGTAMENVAKPMAQAARAPGARNVANAWHAYSTHVFRFNSMLERHFQTAMFGKALKREGHKAIEDAVNGLKGTDAQVRLGRMVDDMYGKYSKWSPSTRHLIATYTPFVSWWLAAAKFVFQVLPRDHPVLTGLLASANVASEQWRKENKLNLEDLGVKAGFLAGSVPLKGGRHVNIARYTPFGGFTNPADVMTTVLPQVASLAAAAKGEDWKGHQYKSAGEGFKGLGTELAGAYVPGFQRQQAIKKYGVAQSVNPYRPIAPGKKKTIGKPKQFKFDAAPSGGFDWEGGSGSDSGFDWGG